MLHVPRPCLVDRRHGTHAEALKTLTASLGLSSRVQFLDEVATTISSSCMPARSQWYFAAGRRLRLRHARIVSLPQARGDHRRRRRTERVRDERRQWMVTAPDPQPWPTPFRPGRRSRQSARMGDEGYDLARGISWAEFIDRLTSA
jgi:hypothetical protein